MGKAKDITTAIWRLMRNYEKCSLGMMVVCGIWEYGICIGRVSV